MIDIFLSAYADCPLSCACVQLWEREETPRQIDADWYDLVPYMAGGMGDQQAVRADARPRTSAGRVRVKLDWLPPGSSGLTSIPDAGGADSRPESVGRVGTPLTMGPTTTRFTGAPNGRAPSLKEDAVGMAQYAAAVQ